LRYIGEHRTPKHTLVKWYECVPITFEVIAGDDAVDAKWIPRKEVITCCPKAVPFWSEEIKNYFS